ncbi:hypothetical protein, partial [Burkholderia ambifaria]|uniref:hypothetical protein n=1 Tax=Burkholderia ambifaria TaxID=152480 RepID=UPI001ABACE6C
RISSLPSSAHTYRLLIFKEHFCEKPLFLSSAAFSAAEKRDYEPPFFARQQLSELLRYDGGGSTSCAPGLLHTTHPRRHRFPSLPRRVSVSAKEA